MDEKFLQEAMRIGDELLNLAESDSRGVYWQTMSVDIKNNRQVNWRVSEILYKGVSGIALFLAELFRQTQQERFLETAVSAMRWVEVYCRENPVGYFAFYTGRMSVAFAMLRMAEITGDNVYLDSGLEIAQPCLEFLQSDFFVDDLINGRSGALLGLLHLHAATGETWLLDAADRYVEHLLRSVHHGPSGLYWDRDGKQISGLCGFSHGASGLGFVFLECGYYLNNEAFYWLAQQAFLYESLWFDAGCNNWLDLRKGIFSDEDYQEHEAAYLAGDMAFFTQGGDFNAWCHGAAGIGLARLRAFALTGQSRYRKEAENALQKTKATTIDWQRAHAQFTLCHGGGGNADLFIEAARILKNDIYLSWAKTVGIDAWQRKASGQLYLPGSAGVFEEDRSLFLGNAGIGYFFLRLVDPDNVPSLLSPVLSKRLLASYDLISTPHLSLSVADIQQLTLQKIFPRTLTALSQEAPTLLEGFEEYAAKEIDASPKASFVAYMTAVSSSENGRFPPQLMNVYALEKMRLEMDENIPSRAYLYFSESLRWERAGALAALEAVEILTLNLQVNPDVKWFESTSQTMTAPMESQFILLQATALQIVETPVSVFVYILLSKFDNGRNVQTAIDEILQENNITAETQKQQALTAALQQIKELIASAILIEQPA